MIDTKDPILQLREILKIGSDIHKKVILNCIDKVSHDLEKEGELFSDSRILDLVERVKFVLQNLPRAKCVSLMGEILVLEEKIEIIKINKLRKESQKDKFKVIEGKNGS